MPQNLTYKISDVVEAVYNTVVAKKEIHGIADVWFGDQDKIPRTPAVCVESGPLTRILSGVGGKGRTDNNFTIYLIVYICRVQDVQATKAEVDTLADDLQDVLHSDITFGGIIVSSHVSLVEPGYSTRNGALFRAVRITLTGFSKTLIV